MILKSRSSPAPCQLSSVVAMPKFCSLALNPASAARPPCRRALAGHVFSVCLPLAGILIRRVADPDRHALMERCGVFGLPALLL